MLQRDYIMRLIQEFMAAVQKFLEKEEGEYVGDYETIRNLSIDEALLYAREQWEDDQQQERLEMLAELYYAEGCGKQAPLRNILLEKAFRLFDYLSTHDKTFNLGRQQKMTQIRQILNTKAIK